MTNLARRGRHPRRWLLLLLCGVGAPALADTFTVTTTADSGAGSLRQALLDAAASAQASAIAFAPSADGVITLASPLPPLTAGGGDLTVTGNGAANTIIDGAQAHRPFTAESAPGLNFTLRHLTVRNGRGGGSSLYGGAIYFSGTSLTIDGVDFSGNVSGGGGSSGDGGAIFASAAVTIENSLFAANRANVGGAFEIWDGPLLVRNTTVTRTEGNNTVIVFGGAAGAQARLVNATVVDNEARGIRLRMNASLSITNSLVVGNGAHDVGTTDSATVDLATSFNNVIGVQSGAGFTDGSNGNRVGVTDARVGPLGDYGGATRTVALLPGSPALNAGTTAGGDIPASDARGANRVGTPDVGAFESRGFSLTRVGGSGQSATVNTAFSDSLVVQLVADDGGEPVEGGRVTFEGPASGPGVALAPSSATIDADGRAATAAIANGVVGGPYTVTARVANGDGPALGADFALTNLEDTCAAFVFPYTLSGTDNAARVAELRQAIECANANGSDDAIDLGGNTLVFTDGPYLITGSTNALPAVGGGLTLSDGELQRADGASERFRFLTLQSGSHLSVEAMTFRNGHGDGGGAIHNPDGTLDVLDSTFIGNRSGTNTFSLDGGAIDAAGVLRIRGSLFQDNEARSGGAVFCMGADIRNSRFVDNRAGDSGGLAAYGEVAVVASQFIGNQALVAGGMGYAGQADVVNSRFEGNAATAGEGGAIAEIDHLGGALRVANSLFLGNAASDGGAILSQRLGTAELVHVTASLNASDGGALFATQANPVVVRNSILWGNPAAGTGEAQIERSIVQGGFPGGTHILDADPRFGDPSDDDFELAAGSPAIDAGDNAFVPTDRFDVDDDGDTLEDGPDLAGKPRRHDDVGTVDVGAGSAPIADLGALERHGPALPTLDIDDVTLDEGDSGTAVARFTVSLTSPAPAGGTSFDIATADGSATVADDDYVGRSLVGQVIPAGQTSMSFDVVVNGDATFESDETFFVNVTNLANAIYGDGQGTATILNDDADACAAFVFPYTLSGPDNAARVAELRQAIECANANGSDDAIDLGGATLVFADAPYVDSNGIDALPVVTSALTLRNGALERAASAPAFRFLDVAAGGDLTVHTMQLRNGSADTEGGAIRADGALLVKASVFEDNRAATRGGAIATHAATTIVTSRFARNAAVDGAAIAGGDADAIPGGDVTLVAQSRFEANGDGGSRSVIWNKSYFAMVGSLVAGNQLSAAGSSLLAFHDDTAVAELRNVTIADNAVQGALMSWSLHGVQLHNCIVWDNQYGSLGDVSPTHSIVPGVPAVDGNLDQPPGFVGTPGDYRLDAGSPAIDAGDNNYGFNDAYDADEDGDTSEMAPDLDLNPRPLDDAGVVDTGNGEAPILDMGAYEYQVDSVAAGITVAPTGGLVTTEAGGTATFTVVLDRYPGADVTVPISSSDTAEGTVAPASLTFTQADWNRPQTVTVTGRDDGVVDGDQPYTIVTAPASSADPAYDGIDPADVSVVNEQGEIPSHGVGGTVIGLHGSGLVLSLDEANETLPIAADGSFAFVAALAPGAAYTVTVATQPHDPSQTCVVINGSGTMGGVEVDDVVVNCGASVSYAVGGTVSGLAGGNLTLQLNGGGDLDVSVDGDYAFLSRLVDGAGYVVTVRTQPQGQLCTLANASGTVQGADVADVDVSCAPLQANLHLSVDDGHEFARYGQVRDYFVTLGNTGNAAADGVAIAAVFSAAFDVPNVHWQCLGGGAASCTGNGIGGFSDIANVPANGSVTWVVSVPVLGGSGESAATFTVGGSEVADAADTDTLVIFRDGNDVPYGDGAEAREGEQPLRLQDERDVSIEWPASAAAGFSVVRKLQAPDGKVDVQRLRFDGRDFVRLLGTDDAGHQRGSGWSPVAAGARLVVGRVGDDGQAGIVLLEGAARPLALPQRASDTNGEVQ